MNEHLNLALEALDDEERYDEVLEELDDAEYDIEDIEVRKMIYKAQEAFKEGELGLTSLYIVIASDIDISEWHAEDYDETEIKEVERDLVRAKKWDPVSELAEAMKQAELNRLHDELYDVVKDNHEKNYLTKLEVEQW